MLANSPPSSSKNKMFTRFDRINTRTVILISIDPVL
jgi:hypothetical protein